MPRSYLSRRRMDPLDYMLITMGWIDSPSRTNTLYLWSQNYWINLLMSRCTPRLTCMVHTSWCVFKKVTNARLHSVHVMAILSMLCCPLALQMHLSSFNTSWMIFSWIPRWFSSLKHWWDLHFLQQSKITSTTCSTCFGQA